MIKSCALGVLGSCALVATFGASASSHREAPFITGIPKVDGTDFYMFRSYEPGKEDRVILVANYLPLQDSYGGPNYFDMDTNALYQIHIDNNGDAEEDITFSFSFKDVNNNISVDVGGESVAIALKQAGQVGPTKDDVANLNVRQTYKLSVTYGDRKFGHHAFVSNTANGSQTFMKPADNIGNKTIPDYKAYADDHIFMTSLPECSEPGRVFVGQRQESFSVNLGEVFDLVNFNPLGAPNSRVNIIEDKNITSLILEVLLSSQIFFDPDTLAYA
jgi:hypothetical protein